MNRVNIYNKISSKTKQTLGTNYIKRNFTQKKYSGRDTKLQGKKDYVPGEEGCTNAEMWSCQL